MPTIVRVVAALGPALGDVSFTASPDHASVTNYQIRVRLAGAFSTILTAVDIGKPTPNASNVIVWNIATELTALGAGDYEVTVATTTPGGTTDSGETSAFSVPLVAL